MSASIQTAVSDGTMTFLDVSIGYLDRSEISVYFNDIVTSDWDWSNSIDSRIVFQAPSTPVPNGITVKVKRTTDLTALRHEFSKGAAFAAETLDEDLTQILHIAQEAYESAPSGEFFQDINMHGFHIRNLANGTNPQDAMTYGQYQSDIDGTAANAAAAQAAAAAAIAAAGTATSAVQAAVNSLWTVTVTADGLSDNRPALVAAMASGFNVAHAGPAPWIISTPLTFTTKVADAGDRRIFRDTDTVVLARDQPFIRPDWFGSTDGNIMRAVNSAHADGGILVLYNKVYPRSYWTLTADKIIAGTAVPGVDFLSRTNIAILGERLPEFSSNYDTMQGGTIIRGPFYANADGLCLDKLGVDSGKTWTDTAYAGAPQDGLVVGQVNFVVNKFMKNVTIGEVRGLARDQSALVHGILIEAIQGGRNTIKLAEGARAFHAAVLKSSDMEIEMFSGIGSIGGESVIFKSDTYAPMNNVRCKVVRALPLIPGVQESGHGLLIDAVTAPGGRVWVGRLDVANKANGLTLRSNGSSLSDVDVMSVDADGCPISVLYSGDIRRCNVHSVNAKNGTYGAQVEPTVTHPSNYIGRFTATNQQNGLYIGGKVDVGDAVFDNCAVEAITFYNVAARMRLNKWRVLGTSNLWNQQLPLLGTWVNIAGTPFTVQPHGSRIELSGWVTGGASSSVYTISTQTRPATNRRFSARGLNGGAWVNVTVLVDAGTGLITIPDFATAPTGISFDGISWEAPY